MIKIIRQRPSDCQNTASGNSLVATNKCIFGITNLKVSIPQAVIALLQHIYDWLIGHIFMFQYRKR